MDQRRNTSVTDEVLGKVVSEAGEILTVVGRALTFGILTPDTYREGKPVLARTRINEEIGHLLAAVDHACLHGLVDAGEITAARHDMLGRLMDPDRKDYLGRRLAPAVPPGSYAVLESGVRHVTIDGER